MSDRADDAAVDAAALERLSRIGGQAFLLEMIDLFLENAPRRIATATRALEERDYPTLYRSAHSLKSTAGNLGARGLQSAAERVEERAAVQDEEAIAPLVEELGRHWKRVRDQLEAERVRRTAS